MRGTYHFIFARKTAVPTNRALVYKRGDDKGMVGIVEFRIIRQVTPGECPKCLLELIKIFTCLGKIAAKFLLNRFVEVFQKCCAGFQHLVGIGIGAPCADGRSGEIEAATDLPWPSPIPLARMMEAASGLPVKIANDANAATAGDMRYGVSRGLRDIIFLTLGTGVGSGIVCDGKLVEGQRGFAGELGHVKAWRSEGRRCACGREDCLQTYCSAKGVVTTALRILESGRESSLGAIPAGSLTSRDVAEAAHGGDVVAREVLRFTGDVLGEACAQFAAFTDPEAIVLFGGVARAGSFLTDAVKEAFERNVLSLYKGRVRFLVSDLGEADVALLGAAALGWEASGNDF